MKSKPYLVLCHAHAGQPCPIDRLLAFLDVLLGGAALIVGTDDPVRLNWQVGDNKADAGEQLARMRFHFGKNATGFV